MSSIPLRLTTVVLAIVAVDRDDRLLVRRR